MRNARQARRGGATQSRHAPRGPGRGIAHVLLELASLQGDWEESISHIVRVDAEVLRVERVSFWSLLDQPEAIHCDAGYIASSRTLERGATLLRTDIPAYFDALLGERILDIEDVKTDRRMSGLEDYLDARGISSMLDVPVWTSGGLAGVLCHEHVSHRKRRWTASQQDFAMSVAQVVSSALAARARSSAEDGFRRAAFLDRVSRQLQNSLDARTVADRVVRLLLPTFADVSIVWLRQKDGTFEGIASAQIDARTSDVVRGLVREAATADLPVLARQGQSFLLPDATPLSLQGAGISEATCVRLEQLSTRSAMVVPVEVPGRLVAVMALLATSRRYRSDDLALAEEVAERLASALENARLYQSAENARRARDESLVLTAHELRTPLTALQLTTERAVRVIKGDSAADAPAEIDAVARQVRRLSALVQRLLDACLIRAEGLTLERSTVDLAAIVRSRVDAMGERGAAIAVHATSPVLGNWDGGRIAQLVDQLLDNAAKFGNSGPVQVSVDREGEEAVLRVHDQGLGIAPDRLGSLFSLFERTMPKENFGGLGLGLYLANAIALAHGGSITVDSRLGEGATFVVRLPLR